MTARVLLTGISCYIGQHVGAELLRQGFDVVGTVRAAAKTSPTTAAIAAVAPVDRLGFVEADLLSDTGWNAAMAGCTYVIHVASPFFLAEPKDEKELIVPAVEGTRRVVRAAQQAGVSRLVLTSSTVAMVAGKASGRYGPDSWSDCDAKIGAYAKSKTLAERAAWEIARDSTMELAVISPGGVFGPSLGVAGDSQNEATISDMIGGKMPMIPDVAMGMVDVRDVARLHVAALTAPQAAGQRFIAATSEPIEMVEVAAILRRAGYSKVPSRKAPDVAVRLMSLFDRQARGLLPFLGKRIAFDTSATSDILQWQPTPMEASFTEMAASLRD